MYIYIFHHWFNSFQLLVIPYVDVYLYILRIKSMFINGDDGDLIENIFIQMRFQQKVSYT